MTPEALEAKQNYDREYRKKNRQKINRQQREWRARNPDKVKEQKQRYWEKKAKLKEKPEENGEEAEKAKPGGSGKKQIRKAPLPRYVTFDNYGITAERYKELRAVCRSGEHGDTVRLAAYTANPEIAEYILLSVMEDVSYDSFNIPVYEERLGGIYICRTDFYGYRRLFYHYLDQFLEKK